MAQGFIVWLKSHLDGNTPGCVWVDKPNEVFAIWWPKATKNMPLENLGIIWRWFHLRFGAARVYQASTIKGIFR